jgi:CPA2 family monovalent cation:H+ antiporter-2
MGLAGDLCLIVIAAWFAGLLCHALRLPLVLGYIAAGVALSPHTWGPTVHGTHEVEMLADVGVALLLFTVGLEFPLPRLSQVGKVALIGTPVQVLLTIGWGAILGRLCGWSGLQGVWLGALLSLSSTTVVLRCLTQNGVMNTLSSQVMIGMLVVQDLCSVPLLLVLPQLGQTEGSSWVITRTVLIGLVFVTFWLWLAKNWLPRAMTRLVALDSRELFSLTVLAFGLGIGYTAYLLGLSLAFGAFLAGLVLAESEYAHQALSDMGPLRDLFTLIFFASVGMLIDPRWVFAHAGLLLPLIAASWAGKGLILAGIVRAFGYSNVVPWASALYLGQMGELAFVIARLGTQSGSLTAPTYKVLITIAAVSMALTPLIAPWTQPVYSLWRRLRPRPATAPKVAESQAWEQHTIVTGFGRVGRVVATTLQALEMPFVVTERDEHALRRAQEAGFPVIYGEASAPAVLEAARLTHARNIILTFAEPLDMELTVRAIHSLAPQVPIIARASNQEQVEHLCHLGVGRVVVAEMEGALEMVHHCLDQLGLSGPDTQNFVEQIRQQHYAALSPDQSQELLLLLRRSLRRSQNEIIQLEGTAWHGQTLAQLDVRLHTGCTVLAILRPAGTVINPSPEEILSPGDRLLVLGDEEQRQQLKDRYPQQGSTGGDFESSQDKLSEGEFSSEI